MPLIRRLMLAIRREMPRISRRMQQHVNKINENTSTQNTGFLEIPKIQKNDMPKIPRFHADPTLLGHPKESKK